MTKDTCTRTCQGQIQCLHTILSCARFWKYFIYRHLRHLSHCHFFFLPQFVFSSLGNGNKNLISAGHSSFKTRKFTFLGGQEFFVSRSTFPFCPGGGISSYSGVPGGAAKSLETCLEQALKDIPKFRHHQTPLYLGATAGMRLLKSVEILIKTVITPKYY